MERSSVVTAIEAAPELSVNAEIVPLGGGDFAQGAISREARLIAHPDNPGLADKAEQDLASGVFLQDAPHRYVCRCGDGRGAHECNGGNQAFGGIAGIKKSRIIAGAVDYEGSISDAIEVRVKARREAGIPSGAHRADTHGAEGVCGCGECDGGQTAMENYLKHETALKEVVGLSWEKLGFEVAYGRIEPGYRQAMEGVRTLTENKAFKDGSSQVDAVEDNAEEGSVEMLEGGHKEVLWVINTVDGKQFDQAGFIGEFDSFDEENKGIQTFWEDQWSITEELIDEVAKEDQPTVIAADLIRRVATAVNLTKADLNLIILTEE